MLLSLCTRSVASVEQKASDRGNKQAAFFFSHQIHTHTLTLATPAQTDPGSLLLLLRLFFLPRPMTPIHRKFFFPAFLPSFLPPTPPTQSTIFSDRLKFSFYDTSEITFDPQHYHLSFVLFKRSRVVLLYFSTSSAYIHIKAIIFLPVDSMEVGFDEEKSPGKKLLFSPPSSRKPKESRHS